jgi:cobalt-zinc-cadmium efflux system membrane fusion protein
MPRLTSILSAVALASYALTAPAAPAMQLVELDARQVKLLAVRTTTATAATALAVDGLLGSVELPLEGTVAIASEFAGRVASVHVDEGDHVEQGQVLAVVSSRDFAQERARATRLEAEAGIARQQAERDRTLAAEGIVPASRAASSAATSRALEAELNALRAVTGRLEAAHGDATGFVLKTPRAGVVVARHVAAGAALEALATAFVIASGTTWRLEVKVPVKVASSIGAGAVLRVGDVEVEVTGLGLALDTHTQTVMVRGRLPSDSGYVPGQQVSATLALPAPAGAISVPRSAIVRTGESARVFVAEGTRFRAIPIEVLGESGSLAVVAGAVAPGAQVVITGTSALKGLLED